MSVLRARGALVACVLGATFASCGGRALPLADGAEPDSAITRPDSAPVVPVVPDARPVPVPKPDHAVPSSGDCIIAIRVDDCCTQPIPAFAQQLKTDPCLLAYPIAQPIPEECVAKQPAKCQVIDCMWGQPRSRLVQAIPGGSCNWKSECATDADCSMAIDVERCCPCDAAYPKELLAKNACLIKDWAQGFPPTCHACMTGVACEPCPPPPKLSCVPSGYPGINHCQPWPPSW